MKTALSLIWIFVISASILAQAPCAKIERSDVESKVPTYSLPPLLDQKKSNPLTYWESSRRGMILDQFKKNIYGDLPPAPSEMRFERLSEESALDGIAVRRQIKGIIKNDKNQKLEFYILVYAPASKEKKIPVFIALNFKGNHSISTDPQILVNENKKDVPRGKAHARWPLKKIVESGFALATVHYGDFDPDYDDEFKNGVHKLYPSFQKGGDNFSSIGAWAWGIHRIVDYVNQDDKLDGNRTIVLGHSRLGKAALWAGATDERINIVISNDSGAGGAALFRRKFGETIFALNRKFPHWFCRNFKNYNEKEDTLPIDQHMLIALIAPRPVYIASASEDLWADPKGEYLSLLNALPIYQLYGKTKIPHKRSYQSETPFWGDVGHHLRIGKHNLTSYDWENYLKFASNYFKVSE